MVCNTRIFYSPGLTIDVLGCINVHNGFVVPGVKRTVHAAPLSSDSGSGGRSILQIRQILQRARVGLSEEMRNWH